MEIRQYEVKIFGEDATVNLAHFDKSDGTALEKTFKLWVNLNNNLSKFGRSVNIPEALTESMFCMFSGSKRFVKSVKNPSKVSMSFDTYNIETGRAEQIKATSIHPDLTTFGPRSVWDDLYLMDFYREGAMDGSFDLYRIPTATLMNFKVNKNETLKEQKEAKKRPRLHILENIDVLGVKKIDENIRVWEL